MKYPFLALSILVFTLGSCHPNAKKEAIVPMELTTFDTIKLLTPDTIGGMPLMQALQHRKTDREFNKKNLSLKHLSEVLWAANGLNRPDGKRTVPSAMALYPLQTYAVMANGIYLYNPVLNQLEPVVKGDYREITGLQSFVNDAPLNLLYIADFKKYDGTKKVPEEDRVSKASLDAGHCSENVYLYCASEGMKTVVRAGAQDDELYKVLKLNSKFKFILAQTVGY